METVSHREMRNRSGEILRHVEAGESVRITNRGEPVAMIVPIDRGSVDGLIARGEARPPRTSQTTLATIPRVASPASSRELLDDVRGTR